MIKTKATVRPRMTLVCSKCGGITYQCYKCRTVFVVNDDIYCCPIRCEHFCIKCGDKETGRLKGGD